MIIESNHKKVSQFEILKGITNLVSLLYLWNSRNVLGEGSVFCFLFGVRVGSVRFGSVVDI